MPNLAGNPARIKAQISTSTPALRTDKEILDWMQHEGLESVVRCPQFDREGKALGICLWVSHWTPGEVYVSMREAAMAGMAAS